MLPAPAQSRRPPVARECCARRPLRPGLLGQAALRAARDLCRPGRREVSVQPAKIRSMPTRRPIAQSAELGNLARIEDADQQAGDAAEAEQAGVRLAAGDEGDGDPGQAHEEEVDAEHEGQGEGAVVRFDDQPEADDHGQDRPEQPQRPRSRSSAPRTPPATRKAPTISSIQPMKIAVPTEATAGTRIAMQPSTIASDADRHQRLPAARSAPRGPPGPATLLRSPCRRQ